ncbi:acyl-CoA N-acyltransferase [Ophiobolus disseminans]|uniref:Acyl-CoA N-acyltransferase n=1 Tax=Ophiobolus disseminans TaxID=1469910 RepID=A0A6A7AE23_9PLEO|nr:acyl-CoA N-acyltransferase [Ophiobolus disseminans]
MEVNPSSNPQRSLDISGSKPDFNWHITTPRLYLSHLNPSNDAHCDLRVAVLHSPSSKKHNLDAPTLVPDREAARASIASSVENTFRTGYGRYLISLRTGGDDEHDNFSEREVELVGNVSMQRNRHSSVPGPLIPDLGFNILPKYRGKGLANEAASHLMQYFREEKGVEAFAGLTDDDNEDSKRALRRLGFREWGVRRVRGVVNGGKEEGLSVWTVGVVDEGTLEGLGL